MLNNISCQSVYNPYAEYKVKKDKESSKSNSETKKTSSYESKSNINRMINQAELQSKNFETLISSTFKKQSNKSILASYAGKNNLKLFFSNLKVDASTIEKAKQDISDDGYYGVNQTSDRILSFAKSIAGNDPKKLEEMKKAVQKGFDQVEKMWGDKLPEVSQKTYEKVMSTFDEWQNNL